MNVTFLNRTTGRYETLYIHIEPTPLVQDPECGLFDPHQVQVVDKGGQRYFMRREYPCLCAYCHSQRKYRAEMEKQWEYINSVSRSAATGLNLNSKQ